MTPYDTREGARLATAGEPREADVSFSRLVLVVGQLFGRERPRRTIPPG